MLSAFVVATIVQEFHDTKNVRAAALKPEMYAVTSIVDEETGNRLPGTPEKVPMKYNTKTELKKEVKAARADLMPSFSLSAQALFSSGELDLLFHNWVASLAASVAGPLFDGGLRKAEVERARAAAMEQVSIFC